MMNISTRVCFPLNLNFFFFSCNVKFLTFRPLSIGTLAVGCEKGIFIWTVEFSNMHVRPTVNNVCKFVRDDHRYITGLSWNKMVTL